MVQAGGKSVELADFAAAAAAPDSELGFVQLRPCLTSFCYFLSFHCLSLLPVTHPHVPASLKGTPQPRLMHLGPHLLYSAS